MKLLMYKYDVLQELSDVSNSRTTKKVNNVQKKLLLRFLHWIYNNTYCCHTLLLENIRLIINLANINNEKVIDITATQDGSNTKTEYSVILPKIFIVSAIIE